MKLRKIMAGVIAAAVAVTSMAITAISTSADQPLNYPIVIMKDGKMEKNLEHFNDEEIIDFLFIDLEQLLGKGGPEKLDAVEVTLTYDDVLQVAVVPAFTSNGHWVAKGELTDWANTSGNKKTEKFLVTIGAGWYTGEEYADSDGTIVPPALALQCWGGSKGNIQVDGIKFLNEKGKEMKIATMPTSALAAETEAPAVTEAPAETTAAPEETTAAPVETEAPAEDTAEATSEDVSSEEASSEEVAEDAVKEEIDNDAFVFPGKIDIEAAVGDAYADVAAIDVTFKWNSEMQWNGGAGLSGITYADGTADWIGSAEYGNVNANEADYAGKGEGTYRIYDFTANAIEDIVAYGEAGEITAYANLELQGWWNFAEAGVEVSNISFLNADGEAIASLDYATIYDVEEPAEEPAEEAPADAADGKTNPDTGVAGVVAVAGVLAVAGAAVVASRKRK